MWALALAFAVWMGGAAAIPQLPASSRIPEKCKQGEQASRLFWRRFPHRAAAASTGVTPMLPGHPSPFFITDSPGSAGHTGGGVPETARALRIIDDSSSNNNGSHPAFACGLLTTSIDAGPDHGRSEVMWGDENGQRLGFVTGDHVTVEFDVKPSVASSSGQQPADSTWHVVFQFIGALKDQTWSSGPPVTLVHQKGKWYIRGGYAVKQPDGSTKNLGDEAPVAPEAPSGAWQHWKISVYFDGPGKGCVTAALDGNTLFSEWMPRAGTIFNSSGAYSHDMLQLKTGIYSGGGGTAWNREMQHRNIVVTRTNSGGTTTWAAR